ncbi:MAG: imidazolonepropionase [Thermoanaerobaculia bacterium]|nr:imidazolonepropionase [Thermoanaerobaculia bacterium]
MDKQAPRRLFTGGPIATLDASSSPEPYGLLSRGAVLVEAERIAWVGPVEEAPATTDVEHIDLAGRLMTPGLIDCHTHMVFGGDRAREFEMRLEGASYEAIAQSGGGIVSTVHATRVADEEELFEASAQRLDRLLEEGVTTVEIKSGYGLDTATETKMLRVARRLGAQREVDVVTSFLGAHALPPEYRGDREAYLRLLVDEMMPAVAEADLADAVDGFCEGIAFSVPEMERVFDAAADHGLPIKLHAEQLSDLGGAAMAARRGALSCDHLEYLSSDGVSAMASAGTVAVLLPGAFYYLRERHKPPVADLQAAGVPIAVATDLNPGSSPVGSLLVAMNMACVLFGLTPEQALRGVTEHAARALGFTDRGRIAAGLRADLAIWNVSRPGELVYPLGVNPCVAAYLGGSLRRVSA